MLRRTHSGHKLKRTHTHPNTLLEYDDNVDGGSGDGIEREEKMLFVFACES